MLHQHPRSVPTHTPLANTKISLQERRERVGVSAGFGSNTQRVKALMSEQG